MKVRCSNDEYEDNVNGMNDNLFILQNEKLRIFKKIAAIMYFDLSADVRYMTLK